MAAAEFTSESFTRTGPTIANKVVFVTGTSAANDDFITISSMTTVKGVYLIATDGTVGEVSFTGNVITVTNGGTKTWNGFVWGV